MPFTPVRRTAIPTVAAAAVAAGTLLMASPASAAPASIEFQGACQARAILTQHMSQTLGMSITAPDSVKVGEQFSYTMQPTVSSLPDKESIATTTDIQRLKIDWDLPANAEFVSAVVVPSTGKGLTGVAPTVIRVNDAGEPDASGTILRLSGDNETVANSPKASANTPGGIAVEKTKTDLDGNPTADGSTKFQLPAVTVTVKALAEGVVAPTVRVAGEAANYNSDKNYDTFLARAFALGSQQNAPTFCTPKDGKKPGNDVPVNAGGSALATVTVGAGTVDPGPGPGPDPVDPGTGTGSVDFGSLGSILGS
ncbi:Ig-like domain repeat protein [Rhodococcus sp. NPDC059234]|uniref:Ig-like domain repeat protein n=1 Tax=Rhodococcus sp. NPDC059234 TaxID=3346781 RepID=UPI0036702632